ncbi:MAG: non-canonical purine NTP pyrophosphatase [Candidatus Thorarchaeota archaeon]
MTGNPGKVVSAMNELSDYDIDLIRAKLEVPEPQSYSLREIAREKALYVHERTKKPLITCDSGFYMDDWNDYPGTNTKQALHGLGLNGILKLAKGTSRKCRFRSAVAFIEKNMLEPKIFENEIPGTVTEEVRGEANERQWSELHRIMVPEDFDKTFSEMSDEEYAEYNRWRNENHPLFSAFGDWLTKRNESIEFR